MAATIPRNPKDSNLPVVCFILCPPAIGRKTNVGTWTSPWKEKERLPFFKFHMIPLRWLLCWNLLNSAEIFPNGKSAQRDFFSPTVLSSGSWRISPNHIPLDSTNGWNLKIHPKEKGETSTTQIPPFFLCFQPFVSKKLMGLFSLYLLGGLFFRKFPAFPVGVFGGTGVSRTPRRRFFRKEGSCCWCLGQCSLPFWSENLDDIFSLQNSMGKTGGKNWRMICWLQRTTGLAILCDLFLGIKKVALNHLVVG